jgi:SAM-dependent methyltransferase
MEVGLVKEQLDQLDDPIKMLDVGCGGGETAIAVAQQFRKVHVTGLDLSPDLIQRAKKRALHLRRHVDFLQGSALNLPFKDNSFEFVTSFGSLKFWPDMRKGLLECIRVLKPDGHLVVVEGDRACRLDDTSAFVRRSRIPDLVSPLGVAFIRTAVAGICPTVEEARELAVDLPIADLKVNSIPEIPFLVIAGRKPILKEPA